MMRIMARAAALLVLSLLALAQPEAPIAWGEPRWLGIGSPHTHRSMALLGDTLVALLPWEVDEQQQLFQARYAYSHDGGQTWSPWTPLDTLFWGPDIRISGTPGRISIIFSGDESGGGYRSFLRSSDDGGVTWGPRQLVTSGYLGAALESGPHTLVLKYVPFADSIVWLAYVRHRTPPWTRDTLSLGLVHFHPASLAATQSRFVAIAARDVQPAGDYDFLVSTRARSGGPWTEFALLPQRPGLPVRPYASIAADTAGETAIVVQHLAAGDGMPGYLYVTRTTDGGAAWSEPAVLNEQLPTFEGNFSPPFSGGQYFGIAWMHGLDSVAARRGLYVRISANHGRNWYPPQQVDASFFNGSHSNGQFVGNRLQLFWSVYGQGHGWDFRTATGTITPDTLPPVIQPLDVPYHGQRVGVGDSLRFRVWIEEDDALDSQVVLWLWPVGAEAFTLPLAAGADSAWQTVWRVPADGTYRYRIACADYWENPGTYPLGGGWYRVSTPGADSDASFPYPSSFSLSVSPNPFNSAAMVQFELPRAMDIELAIYDITGRQTAVLREGMTPAGSHTVRWDARALPSGLYFARLHAGGRSQIHKVILLR